MKKMTELEVFKRESIANVETYKCNNELRAAARNLIKYISPIKYTYNFFWCGVPIVQLGQDLQALQEIIWTAKPDCIIETGVAWGGSLMFSASMLCILEACDLIENGSVIGIDIDIRPHNRQNIEAHPLAKKITLIEGSSITETTIQEVHRLTENKKRIMVMLDSNHTHDHVLAELKHYTPLISVGSYCVVGDTAIEDFDNSPHTSRPWCKGNSPKTAVHEFLKSNDSFELDKYMEEKLLVTCSPDGFLKRIR